ncbi:MAG: Fic family protein [Thermodesulfovibrionales bacterium]|nr:Fic family protein [Thermodesulfovibrionales bacterium]
MKRKNPGRYITTSTTGETVKAYVPNPLPPDPPLQISTALRRELDKALLALGRLDSVSSYLPDANLLLYTYIRKEAVLSSQIEGTQSSLSDLLLFEMDAVPGVPIADVKEVSNYVSALTHGLDRIRSGFPLSNRLLKEIHAILLSGGRGGQKNPGEFRRSQNWIGGTRPGNAVFVPPPPNEVPDCMGELELFLNNERGIVSGLEKAALSHVQFETIHPFLDGNGRLGRLLITLILCVENILTEPLLYLSLYFKSHRNDYYDLLQKVRVDGDWEIWFEFFIKAVSLTAEQATGTARKLSHLADENRKLIQGMGRIAGSSLMIHQNLMVHPLTDSAHLSAATGLVPNTVNKVLKALITSGIVEEVTGKGRNRIYVYRKYLDVMNEGTEPL